MQEDSGSCLRAVVDVTSGAEALAACAHVRASCRGAARPWISPFRMVVFFFFGPSVQVRLQIERGGVPNPFFVGVCSGQGIGLVSVTVRPSLLDCFIYMIKHFSFIVE